MKKIVIMLAIFTLCVTMSFAQLSWTQLTSLDNGRQMCGIAANTQAPYFLYVIGGNAAVGTTEDVLDANADSNGIYAASFSPTTGAIGTWNFVGLCPDDATTFYNFSYIEQSCFCYNGFLYIVGGNTNSSEANRTVVTYAPINTDGTLGTWQTKSYSPPGDGESMGPCLQIGGKIYILGGSTNASGLSPKCYIATINGDGSISDFAEDTDSALPVGLYFHRAVALGGYIFVIGGYTTAAVDTVYSAPINGDGTLGTWTAQAVLPAARHDGAAFTLNGKIYYAGGTGYVDTVYVATPTGGTIASWATDTTLPYPRRRGGAATYGDFIYLAGWRSSSSSVDPYVYGVISGSSESKWNLY